MPVLPRATLRRRPKTAPLLVLAVLATGVLIDASASGGQVKGRIDGQETLTPAVFVEAAKTESHRFTWREPSPTVRAEFRALTANPSRDVCIAALSSSASPPHDPILVRITGGRTLPTTLVIGPGVRLSFENHDPFPHRLYVVGRQDWKAETIESKANRQWTAPGPGRYEIRDELFPSVRSYVVVEPQVVAIAFPGRDGAFALDLPAGEFTLKAYFDGRAVGRALSVVTKDRGLVELREPLSVSDASGGKSTP
jgi:plastocyanin